MEPDKDTQLTVYQAVVQKTRAEVISMHLQLQTMFLSIQLKRLSRACTIRLRVSTELC